MGLTYRNLDDRTRSLMVAEIKRDIAANTLFLSDNLSAQGRIDYPNLIQNAASTGSDVTLAAEIKSGLNTHEKPRRLKSGEFSKPPIIRSNAHEMLGEGEFNRFYIRAVCLRAIEDNIAQVVIYRAKQVENPRLESEAKIGQSISAQQLLEDLRAHPGVDTSLGLPPGPNSGLSIHLP